MDLGRVAELIHQIGGALGAAHRKGIWHRDLKPANIMIQTLDDGDQRIKLIDFGISTVQHAEALADSTQSGTRPAALTIVWILNR